MRYLLLILLLAGCGTGSGKNDDTKSATDSSQCSGDVVFNTEVPDEDVPADDSGDVDNSDADVPGIVNPAVSKALKLAELQGLKVVSLEKLDHVTIVGTCDATINVNVDSGNSSTVPVSE